MVKYLSIVSLPDFNINKRIELKNSNYINKITKEFLNLDQFLKLLHCFSFRMKK